jgi:hypothetical protein
MNKSLRIFVLLVVCFLFLGVVRAEEKHCVCNDTQKDIPHDQTCTQDSDCYNACSVYNGPYKCKSNSNDNNNDTPQNTPPSNDTQENNGNTSHCFCKDGGTYVEFDGLNCNIGDDSFCTRECLNLSSAYTTAKCGNPSGGNGENGRNGGKKESTVDPANFDIPTNPLSCKEIAGTNVAKLISAAITIFQVACVIFALVKGMTILIPPIISKDMDALSKSARDLVLFAIILLAALLFRPIVAFIGKLTDFDVSCITWIFKGYF